MPSGEGPRLRVVHGGGLSGHRSGTRLRSLGLTPQDGPFDWRAELELVAPDVLLPPGCGRAAIAAAEGSLGWTLPPQLVEFLTAADGVYDVDSHHWYAWSLERLVDENFEAERPGDVALIGDDAGSGWFALPLQGRGGALHIDRVTGERRTLARDLRGLWLGWFGGTLRV
jgi:hypothetical protein